MNNYANAGIGLFISVAFLTAGIALIGRGRMILPLIMNIIGTGGYVYAISVIGAIRHEKIPKEATEPLMARIYPAISVTVLLLVLIIMNYFSPYQEAKREAKRKARYEAVERPLTKDEKII